MTLSARAMTWLEGRSLDVELADRLGIESRGGGDRECLIYPFFREGRVVDRKYRPFVPQEGKPRFWRDKEGVRCFYNEDCLRDDGLITMPLVITEGQDDAIAAIQSSFLRTVSVPDGAPENPVKDIHESIKYAFIDDAAALLSLDRVKEIILATDGDSAGAALLHDLSVKLGKPRCKFVTYPRTRQPERWGRDRLKDLNEVLIEYGADGVRAVLARAAWLKVNGVYAMSDLPPMPKDTIYDIGFEAMGEHYKMRLGDTVALTGIPGYGKTTWINDVVCRVTTAYGVRCAWASFEQSPQRDHRRALRQWHAEEFEFRMDANQMRAADAWIEDHHRFIVPDEDDDVTLDWMLEKMEVAVIQHGCKIFIIDPWNEMDHDRAPGESETDYTNRAIRLLKRFAKRFQIHLVIVAHPAKMRRNEDGSYPIPSAYDISGSAAWANKPELVIIVHRDGPDTTIVKTQKSKYWDLIGRPGMVQMAFTAQTRRYTEIDRSVLDPDQKPRSRR